VLVDAGLPRAADLDRWDDAPEGDDPTAARMETPCASADEYLAIWRAHPAFARAWDHDVEAYARYDMVEDCGRAHCVVSRDAVLADTFDLLCDGKTRTAIARVQAPVRLLCAPRGALDDDCAVTPREYAEAFAAGRSHLKVEHVSDTNHYTIVLGSREGPARVAAAIHGTVRDAAS
jgi:hypothetical protein